MVSSGGNEDELLTPPPSYRQGVWGHFGFLIIYDSNSKRAINRTSNVCRHCYTCLMYVSSHISNMNACLHRNQPSVAVDVVVRGGEPAATLNLLTLQPLLNNGSTSTRIDTKRVIKHWGVLQQRICSRTPIDHVDVHMTFVSISLPLTFFVLALQFFTVIFRLFSIPCSLFQNT